MTKSRWLGIAVALGAIVLSGESTAQAQSPSDPNSGALKFSGGFDVLSVEVFRGFVQDQEPRFTGEPYADLGIVLRSGDGVIKKTVVNVGVSNSLDTGASGTNGPSGQLHYEEDFYTRLSLLFGHQIAVDTGFLARTSPNNMFNTEKELDLRVAQASRLSPYAFLASELDVDGQADNGVRKGTYLELGVAPSFSVGGARLGIPAIVGLSVNDYYELAGKDHAFGYFTIGATLTVPLKTVPSRFGSWNVHGGGQLYLFGDATKVTNDGKATKPVGFVGIGVTY